MGWGVGSDKEDFEFRLFVLMIVFPHQKKTVNVGFSFFKKKSFIYLFIYLGGVGGGGMRRSITSHKIRNRFSPNDV